MKIYPLLAVVALAFVLCADAIAVRIELPDVPAEVNSRLCPANGSDVSGDLTKLAYYLECDTTEPTLDLYESELRYLKPVIVQAAWAYALDSGDYRISLRDIVDSGFFPYGVIPAGLDWDACIKAHSNEADLSYMDLTEIGSDEWLVRQKSSILWMFYTYYYYPTAYGGFDPNFEASLPDKLPRYEKFWVNPYTDKPATTDDESGGLHEVQLGLFRDSTSPYATDEERAAIAVPMFGCPEKCR